MRRNLTPVESRGITPIIQVLLSPTGWEMKRPFAPSGPPIQLRLPPLALRCACKTVMSRLPLFTVLVFRLAGWLSGMEVIDKSSIEKTDPTRSIVVRDAGGRAPLDCSKVNRVGEADIEAAKKLRRSIRNPLWSEPRVDDRTDHPTANLEIRPQANMCRKKADAKGDVRRGAAV